MVHGFPIGDPGGENIYLGDRFGYGTAVIDKHPCHPSTVRSAKKSFPCIGIHGEWFARPWGVETIGLRIGYGLNDPSSFGSYDLVPHHIL